MKSWSRGSVGLLALLGSSFLICDVKTVVWLKLGDPDYPLDAMLFTPKPAEPDAQLPSVEAHNEFFAGYAPGHSLGSGLDDAKNGIIDWVFIEESPADRIKRAARAAQPRDYPTPQIFASSDSDVTPLTAKDAMQFVKPPAR